MKMSFITRTASIMLIWVFLFNDIVGVSKAWSHYRFTEVYEKKFQNSIDHFPPTKSSNFIKEEHGFSENAPGQIEKQTFLEKKEDNFESIQILGLEDFGTIGASLEDPMNNPTDDIFSFIVQHDPNEYEVTLTYEYIGVENHQSIGKIVNGAVYFDGEQMLDLANEWKLAKEKLPKKVLTQGLNTICFSIANGLPNGLKIRKPRNQRNA
jgi:hypothetical protein